MGRNHRPWRPPVLSRSDGLGWAEILRLAALAQDAFGGLSISACGSDAAQTPQFRLRPFDFAQGHARKASQVAPYRRLGRGRNFFGTAEAVPYAVAPARTPAPTTQAVVTPNLGILLTTLPGAMLRVTDSVQLGFDKPRRRRGFLSLPSRFGTKAARNVTCVTKQHRAWLNKMHNEAGAASEGTPSVGTGHACQALDGWLQPEGFDSPVLRTTVQPNWE